MRYFLFTICVFILCHNYVFGAVSIIPADDTPGHPGYCNSKETGPMEKNEEKTIAECVRASCNSDASIELASCGKIQAPCGITDYDLSAPYPECCPKPKLCDN